MNRPNAAYRKSYSRFSPKVEHFLMEVPRGRGRFLEPSSEPYSISLVISVLCSLTSLFRAVPIRSDIPLPLLDLPEFSCT